MSGALEDGGARAPAVCLPALLVAVSACGQSEPFRYDPPEPVGPFQMGFPRRLTFSDGDDRTPMVAGMTLVFSRRLPDRPDGDRCLEFLPVEGGTLTRTTCPGGEGAEPDTIVDAFLLPALSPDGQRIAYVREAGIVVNVVPATRQLVVAPASTPEQATLALDTPYRLPDGRMANQFDAVTWADGATLRFIAGLEIVNSFIRPADTTFTPFAVVEVDVATGAMRVVPGTADAVAFAAAPDGGLWYARREETVVWQVGPDAPAVVADFGLTVRSIANAAGSLVAVVEAQGPEGPVPLVMAYDAATGVARSVWNGLFPIRITGVPERPWVVAAIHRGERPNRLGGGASLWLLEVP